PGRSGTGAGGVRSTRFSRIADPGYGAPVRGRVATSFVGRSPEGLPPPSRPSMTSTPTDTIRFTARTIASDRRSIAERVGTREAGLVARRGARRAVRPGPGLPFTLHLHIYVPPTLRGPQKGTGQSKNAEVAPASAGPPERQGLVVARASHTH